MQPSVTEFIPSRGPFQEFRVNETVAFECFRCGHLEHSKIFAIYQDNPNRPLCEKCYRRLLSIYDIKAGSMLDDKKAEKLAEVLIASVPEDKHLEERRLLREKVKYLGEEAERFVATASYVAKQLGTEPDLEWSPAVIGLCKAVEVEIVRCMLRPLAKRLEEVDLADDIKDNQLKPVAKFCAVPRGKPPEIGSFAFFLKTSIESVNRRRTSKLLSAFYGLTNEWIGSRWVLELGGLYQALDRLSNQFRNPAAHISILSMQDYESCHKLVLDPEHLLWNIVSATDRTCAHADALKNVWLTERPRRTVR